ncbi:MAG: P-type conjugative transfer protein TrbL [Proteobacteria bacterium]|nr:P-type conjugative transfer protein TrbL [Pseudomonadota bacterium]
MSAGVETPNDLMVVFSDTVSAGFDALQAPVNSVFGLLIVLVVALTGIQWALSPNREVLASGFGKVLLIGVFAWLINDWQQLSETIYAGFLELGLTAGGGSLSREEFLNPGAILAQGWEIVKALGETPAPVDNPLDVVGNLADALILGVAMIGIMLAFAVLALQIIVSLLEFKIVTLGGFVLLPFGIWSKSAFLAERPLGYVVASGLKVLALAIVVSGAQTIFNQLQPSTNPDIYEALSILVASLLLAMLALFIPNLASALVTGGPALGAGAAVTGALAVGGVSALAAAGVARAGAAVGAGRGGSARAAAGAGSGRSSTPPAGSTPPKRSAPSPGAGPTGGGAAPRASNDNPSGSAAPRGAGRGAGKGAGKGVGKSPASEAMSGASRPGVAEPAAAFRPMTSPDKSPASPSPASSAGSTPAGGKASRGTTPGRSPESIAAETEGARRDFHRAAAGSPGAGSARRPQGRSAALQAFFIANAGRGLLPAGETSGVLSPKLKTEEP